MPEFTTCATLKRPYGSERVLHFGLQPLFDFEVAANFVALLMHPATTEIDERQIAFLGLCAAFAAEQVRSVPTEAANLREVRPEYFSVAQKDYRRSLRQAKTQLRYRLLAALMARPFVGQAKLGDGYEVPPDLGELTPTNVAEFASAKHNIMSGENLMQRAWRPSLPVLHLAIGLDNAIKQRELPATPTQNPDELIEPWHLPCDLQDIGLFRSAIQLSSEAADIIRNDERIKIADHEIVEICWCV